MRLLGAFVCVCLGFKHNHGTRGSGDLCIHISVSIPRCIYAFKSNRDGERLGKHNCCSLNN